MDDGGGRSSEDAAVTRDPLRVDDYLRQLLAVLCESYENCEHGVRADVAFDGDLDACIRNRGQLDFPPDLLPLDAPRLVRDGVIAMDETAASECIELMRGECPEQFASYAPRGRRVHAHRTCATRQRGLYAI